MDSTWFTRISDRLHGGCLTLQAGPLGFLHLDLLLPDPVSVVDNEPEMSLHEEAQVLVQFSLRVEDERDGQRQDEDAQEGREASHHLQHAVHHNVPVGS